MPEKTSTSTQTTSSELVSSLKKTAAKKEKPVASEQQFTVVKRNGAMVPFRRERILRALDAAFRDTKRVGKEETLPEEVLGQVEEVTEKLSAQLFTLATKGAALTVEGIQDLVEVTLMKSGHHDVA